MQDTLTTTYWLSSNKMTVYAIVNNSNNIIIETAPVTTKFIGQTLDNLKYWMQKQGKFKCQILTFLK